MNWNYVALSWELTAHLPDDHMKIRWQGMRLRKDDDTVEILCNYAMDDLTHIIVFHLLLYVGYLN